jgi:phosphohistidine phosphatase SixA
MSITLRTLAILLALVGTAWSQTSPPVDAVLKLLGAGGYVIVFRHGATYADQADTDPLNLDDVAKQRQLNDTGRADAKVVGEVFKAAGFPIGKCYSSRFQRAVETARLIGGKEPQTTLDITEGGLVVSLNENNRRTEALRALVATPPDPGTSTLVITRLVRDQRGRGVDLQAREQKVRDGRPRADRPVGGGIQVTARRDF